MHYFKQALAISTLRTYQSGHDRFLKFSQLSGAEPLLAAEVVLRGFIAHLAETLVNLNLLVGDSCKGRPG